MSANDDLCARCNKLIFVVDLKRSGGKTFHSWCFKCHTCAATLTLGKEKSHLGELFCSRCHQQSFGSVGFRGAGSSIDSHERAKDVHQTVATPASSVPSTKPNVAAALPNTAAGANVRFCGACGAEASGAARFCGGCGEPM